MSMVSQSHQWLLSKRQYLLVSWSSHANIKLPLRRYVWRGLRYPNYNYFSRTLLWHGSLHWNFLYSIFLFKDLLDSCRSLVPVDKVIYRALEELEKKFDMTVLCELFNEVNMEKYPNLNLIRRSFECGIGFYIAPWEHSPFCCQQMYIKLLSCAIYHAEQLRI